MTRETTVLFGVEEEPARFEFEGVEYRRHSLAVLPLSVDLRYATPEGADLEDDEILSAWEHWKTQVKTGQP